MARGGRLKNGNPKGPYLRLTVAQNDRRPLDRFHAAVRGKGTITGPYVWANGHSINPKWVYRCGERQGIDVLRLLSEYLSEPKREQALRCFSTIRERNAQRVTTKEKLAA